MMNVSNKKYHNAETTIEHCKLYSWAHRIASMSQDTPAAWKWISAGLLYYSYVQLTAHLCELEVIAILGTMTANEVLPE